VAGLCATGAGDAKLLVEGFLGLCSGVHQDLPRGVDRGLNLRALRVLESWFLLAGGGRLHGLIIYRFVLSGSKKGAVAQNLSTVGLELGQGQFSQVPVVSLAAVVSGNCPQG
jgi:hypothetical protein